MYKELKRWETKYADLGYKTIGLTIDQKYHEGEQKWKKKLPNMKSWKDGVKIEKAHNAIALICGKNAGIFVLDVDNVNDWEKFLEDIGQEEPTTVKAKSGNGGFHYYFKYTDKLDAIKNLVKAITYEGKILDIDVKTNEGFIICPPSKYFNKNVDKETSYEWIYDIVEHEMIEVPDWLYQYLIQEQPKKKKSIYVEEEIDPIYEEIEPFVEEILSPIEEKQTDDIEMDTNDIAQLVEMLSKERCDNRKSWIDVGILLHNLGSHYYMLWEKWSRKSKKFDKKECIRNWKSFDHERCKNCKDENEACMLCKGIRCKNCIKKKDKCDGCKNKTLGIGSLKDWAKKDNPKKYEEYTRTKGLMKIVERNKNKFPDNELVVSKAVFSKHQTHVELSDKFCPFIKENHIDDSVRYLLFSPTGWSMSCTSPECRGKTIPCEDYIKYARNDMKVICINQQFNYYGDAEKKEEDYDIPADYNIFEDEELNQLMYESLSGKSYPMSKLLWHLYQDRYRCTKDGIWYIFRNHRWHGDVQCLTITMSEDLIPHYKTMKNHYSQLKSKSIDEHTKIQYAIKRISKLIDDLNSITQKNIIINEAKIVFHEYDKDFEDKLDENASLIGFNNGVFDFNTVEFRDGKPEDYITKSVGYDYDEKKKPDELRKIIEQILPIEEVRKYTMKLFSICLNGNIKIQKVHFLNGNGSNGKSLIIALLKQVLGQYMKNVPVSIITSKRTAGESASPQLYQTKGKRIIYFQEPNQNDILNIGVLKEWSGSDVITTRDLHKSPIEFMPQFKMFIISNKLPKIDINDNDYATWRRIRNIRFISTFVDGKIKEDAKYVFKKDPKLEQKVAKWKAEFFNLLVEYHKLYLEEGLEEPSEITQYTDAYKKEDDYFEKFRSEYIKETKNTKDYIVWTELRDQFLFSV